MSVKFNDFLVEQLKDEEIRAEYERLQPEFAVVQAFIDARISSEKMQKDFSEKTGIAQFDTSGL